MPHAMLGISMNCAASPTAIERGMVIARRKSSMLRVMPIPSMITPRPQTMKGLSNHVKAAGSIRAPAQHRTTQSGKRFVNVPSILCMERPDLEQKAGVDL